MRHARIHRYSKMTYRVRRRRRTSQYFYNLRVRRICFRHVQSVRPAVRALVRVNGKGLRVWGPFGHCHSGIVEVELDALLGEPACVEVDGMVAEGIEGGGKVDERALRVEGGEPRRTAVLGGC